MAAASSITSPSQGCAKTPVQSGMVSDGYLGAARGLVAAYGAAGHCLVLGLIEDVG